MFRFTTIFIFILFSINTFSQSFTCGINYFDSIEVANDPSIIERRQALEKFTSQYMLSKNRDNDKIIIPIVFHVLHQYGNERLSKQYIENAVANLNLDYSAQNTDLGQVINEFRGIIGNANFEFRLAKIDPDGNPTDGIMYYTTELTYNASNALKYTIKNWDPAKYLNVWTVNSIESGAAAWSHYPGISKALDGVVSIYTYVGSGHTLGHEIGHYLNLMHPWGNSNEPGLASNCNMDDGVDDTPLTSGVDQNCNLAQVTCGSLDNVQNIMDYSTCDAMFTHGQTLRMRAALNSSVSGRNNLCSQQNLEATGVADGFTPVVCAPVADFGHIFPSMCPGSAIQFNDYSWGGPADNWEWVFEGGEPQISTQQNPVVTYNTPGKYSVKLTVSNATGENTIEHTNIINIIDIKSGLKAPVLYTMNYEGFPFFGDNVEKAWTVINSGNNNWETFVIDTNTMLRINNQNPDGLTNSIITPNIDLTTLGNPGTISFDVAFAKRTSDVSNDELRVYLSKDCGKTWIRRYAKSGVSLITNNSEPVTAAFIPTENQWRTDVIKTDFLGSISHLLLKFEMKSLSGNYLYIDNLKIGEPVIEDINYWQKTGLNVYPNPANNVVNVSFSIGKNQNVEIRLLSIDGKTLHVKNILAKTGDNQHTINLQNLNIEKGLYLLTFKTDNNITSKPIVITR